MKIGVIGFGAFTREILPRLKEKFDIFVLSDYIKKINQNELNPILDKYNAKIYTLDAFNKDNYKALITLTDGIQREKIVNVLPSNTEHYTFIDEKAVVYDAANTIGRGSIICAGTIITTNVKLEDFVQINLNTTIGHDVHIGPYVTCAPGVNISGRCRIGSYSYLGTNASIKQNLHICEKTIIGAQSTVVKNIQTSGTYIGVPVKRLEKNLQ